MNCEQALELSGAYALQAVDPAEAEEMSAHLADCDACRTEVRSLQQVVQLLPYAAEEVPVSASLRDRLMSAVNQTDGRLLRLPSAWSQPMSDGAPARSSTPPEIPAVAAAAPRRRPTFNRYFPAMAAALLAVTSLFGATTYTMWQNQPRTYPLHGFGTAAQATGSLVYLPGQHTAYVNLIGLRDPGATHVYELWLIRDGQPVGAGLFRPDTSGKASATVNRDLSGYQVLAVTEEPDGGSVSPTGEPLVTQKL